MDEEGRFDRIWNPIFISLMVFELSCQFGLALVNPITSNFAVSIGATTALAGFMLSLHPMTATVLRPLAGLVLGRFARKRLLVAAAVIFATSSYLCAIFANLPFLAISRVVMGAAFVVKSTMVVAFASSVVPKDSIGQGVAFIGVNSVIGNAVGPAVGSFLGTTVGYQVTYFTSAALFTLAIVLAVMLKDPHEEEDRARREANAKGLSLEALKDAFRPSNLFHFKTFPLAAFVVLEAFLYGSVSGLVILTGEMRGVENAAIFFMVYAVVTAIARPVFGRMCDKYGLKRMFYPEAFIMMLSPLVLAFADTVFLTALAGFCLALGQGTLYPSLQAEAVRGVPHEETTLAVNTFYIGADAGMAIGPLVSGFILGLAGPFTMYMVNVAMAVILMVAFPFFLRYQARQLQASETE